MTYKLYYGGTEPSLLHSLDLYRRVAELLGVKLENNEGRGLTEPLKEYVLSEEMITLLAGKGIKYYQNKDQHNPTIVLRDENNQNPPPGYAPSHGWVFEPDKETGEYDLRIALRLQFIIDQDLRGIVLRPVAEGGIISPADNLPNARMFQALGNADKDAPLAIQRVATNEGDAVVSWTELGLGGLRWMRALFEEFRRGNETIRRLQEKTHLLDPDPDGTISIGHHRHDIFVAETAQPALFERWERQISEFARALRVVR